MDKTALRKKYKTLRNQLTSDQIDDLSLDLANRALSIPIWDKSYYHIFLPISKQKELDTQYLLHILQGKDKHIIVPKSDFETETLQHILLTDNTPIQVNKWGIPEPVSGIPIPEASIEVVFIPLLAFDTHGNRVGYGKGFYDKFLALCNSNTLKIGLSLFQAEEELIDVLPTDIPLNYCITPEKTYIF
ncbi:5-formyltetrahydrofolate cyclo-ligase [Aquimarina rhabdastrellae]